MGMKKVFAVIAILCFVWACGLPLSSAQAAEEATALPVLMYHSISTTQKGVYFVSPEQLNEDLSELKKRGYTFVTVAAVTDYLNGKGDLPEKPVLLTFDDGHYDNLYYGLPILKKHDAKAVIHVIGCFTEYSSTHEKDHLEYSHLTWDEIAYLGKSGVFEIGSHTYRMHSYRPRFGVKRQKGETEEAHRRAVKEDLETLDRALLDKCGLYPVCFAYPFGAYDEGSEEVVNERYGAVFTCYEKINKLKRGDIKKLSKLYRINRDGRMGSTAFLNKHGIV